jgi:lipopolysaccharide export system permease protein
LYHFIFVGAPLGALIRKGGIGLPLVVAILLFLTYHFIGIFATNSAKSGGLNPVIAAWCSTLVMLPLSIVLTRTATGDRGLFNFDHLIEPIKNLLNIKDKEDEEVDYKFLLELNNERLFDIIINFDEQGYNEAVRYEAISILKSRGVTSDDIRNNQIPLHKSFDKSEKLYTDFKAHGYFSLALYSIGIILLLLFFVFKNNKLPSVASASIQLSIISLILFIIYYIKSYLNIFGFYTHIKKKQKTPNVLLILIGVPLYFLSYFLLKRKLSDDLKQNCVDSIK